jgi:alpha-galactosidase
MTVSADFSALHLAGRQRVRDLWRQKDLGDFADKFETPVPPHGAVLLQLRNPSRG